MMVMIPRNCHVLLARAQWAAARDERATAIAREKTARATLRRALEEAAAAKAPGP